MTSMMVLVRYILSKYFNLIVLYNNDYSCKYCVCHLVIASFHVIRFEV